MHVLVVHCHPCPESYGAAVRDAVCVAVRDAGHDLELVDLYAEGFEPAMSPEERRGYHDESDNIAPVRAHVERVAWAEAVIFVYPTWWFGPPAMLKGWLDRVLVPGFAFEMPKRNTGPRPGLTHIRHLGVFTTCGANWLTSWLMGFPGRRMLLRGFRSNCHLFARTGYHAIYRMDSSSARARERFLESIPESVVRLLRPRLIRLRASPRSCGVRGGRLLNEEDSWLPPRKR